MKLKELIKEQLLLEKRIAQISSTIEVTFGFDVVKTKHAEKRKDVTKRNLGHERMISNAEMKEVVSNFKKDIAEGIVDGDIQNETNFVIKDSKFGLSMVLIAEQVSGNYWKLIIKTVFRETTENPLRVGRGQIVYSK